jgi:hypothetical protein
MNVRVQPEIHELIRKHAEGAHGLGIFLSQAVRAYIKQLQQADKAQQ